MGQALSRKRFSYTPGTTSPNGEIPSLKPQTNGSASKDSEGNVVVIAPSDKDDTTTPTEETTTSPNTTTTASDTADATVASDAADTTVASDAADTTVASDAADTTVASDAADTTTSVNASSSIVTNEGSPIKKEKKKVKKLFTFSLKRSRPGSGRKKSKKENGSTSLTSASDTSKEENRQSLFLEEFEIPECHDTDAVDLSDHEDIPNISKNIEPENTSTPKKDESVKKTKKGFKSLRSNKKSKKNKSEKKKKVEEAKVEKKKEKEEKAKKEKELKESLKKKKDSGKENENVLVVEKSVVPFDAQSSEAQSPEHADAVKTDQTSENVPTSDTEISVNETGTSASPPSSPRSDEDDDGTPKRVSLGPRLKTAILRKVSSGKESDSSRVTLTRPKTIDIPNPPPRKHRKRPASLNAADSSVTSEGDTSVSTLDQSSNINESALSEQSADATADTSTEKKEDSEENSAMEGDVGKTLAEKLDDIKENVGLEVEDKINDVQEKVKPEIEDTVLSTETQIEVQENIDLETDDSDKCTDKHENITEKVTLEIDDIAKQEETKENIKMEVDDNVKQEEEKDLSLDAESSDINTVEEQEVPVRQESGLIIEKKNAFEIEIIVPAAPAELVCSEPNIKQETTKADNTNSLDDVDNIDVQTSEKYKTEDDGEPGSEKIINVQTEEKVDKEQKDASAIQEQSTENVQHETPVSANSDFVSATTINLVMSSPVTQDSEPTKDEDEDEEIRALAKAHTELVVNGAMESLKSEPDTDDTDKEQDKVEIAQNEERSSPAQEVIAVNKFSIETGEKCTVITVGKKSEIDEIKTVDKGPETPLDLSNTVSNDGDTNEKSQTDDAVESSESLKVESTVESVSQDGEADSNTSSKENSNKSLIPETNEEGGENATEKDSHDGATVKSSDISVDATVCEESSSIKNNTNEPCSTENDSNVCAGHSSTENDTDTCAEHGSVENENNVSSEPSFKETDSHVQQSSDKSVCVVSSAENDKSGLCSVSKEENKSESNDTENTVSSDTVENGELNQLNGREAEEIQIITETITIFETRQILQSSHTKEANNNKILSDSFKDKDDQSEDIKFKSEVHMVLEERDSPGVE